MLPGAWDKRKRTYKKKLAQEWKTQAAQGSLPVLVHPSLPVASGEPVLAGREQGSVSHHAKEKKGKSAKAYPGGDQEGSNNFAVNVNKKKRKKKKQLHRCT